MTIEKYIAYMATCTPERRLFNLLIFKDRPRVNKKASMAMTIKCVKEIEFTIIDREVSSSSLNGATMLFL